MPYKRCSCISFDLNPYVRRTISAATKETVKSLSLRSLLVQIAFALTWWLEVRSPA
ncbi:hypothetical protein QUA40_18955 [Microcoleus sp. Pol11C3]|uniref:hypothetical protein n=1 Tax=Microcoleus sp. Pol11C3 TaxID=3055390 RepID=UPI002FD4534A